MKRLILGTVLFISMIIASDIAVELSNKNVNTFASLSKYYKGVSLLINDKKVTYIFKNIPNGTYAIFVIHDFIFLRFKI